ncbi:uncharacterized protein TNCV_4729151 [Trichonephila clavipes]|nr:uncharacterized protein TNCV_4729151 [Trichonephila clavipes]
MLGQRIAARPRPPATLRDLEIALLEEWNSIPQSLIDNLIASMANRTGVVIYKQKFSPHGAPKQTYMLFQNDISIDVACHRYTLNMQFSSGTKNDSSPNEPSCTTVTV